MGYCQVRIPLAQDAEGAIRQSPHLGAEPVVRAEAIEGEGRAHQFLVGGRRAGPLAVDIGQQTAAAVGHRYAPHPPFSGQDRFQARLQGRAAHLVLQHRGGEARGQGRQGSHRKPVTSDTGRGRQSRIGHSGHGGGQAHQGPASQQQADAGARGSPQKNRHGKRVAGGHGIRWSQASYR